MYDDRATTGDTMSTQFMEGTPVLDMAGEKVGTVSEHGVQDNNLVIHHGLLNKDVYIPLGVIRSNDVNGVYLSITKDQALHQDWTTTTSGMSTTAAPTDTMRTEDVRVPVREEELVAGKREEEVGRVHLHKDVVEEQQTVNVPLQQEQVTVERVPVQGQATDVGPDAFTEKDIDVPVKGEEAVVGKQVRETEEVRLRKQPITEEEEVSDTVRKERVVVDDAEGVTVDDTTNRPM